MPEAGLVGRGHGIAVEMFVTNTAATELGLHGGVMVVVFRVFAH
jgi:hypothetical protein